MRKNFFKALCFVFLAAVALWLGSSSVLAAETLDAEQYVNTFLVAEPKTLNSSLASDVYSDYIFRNIMEGLTRLEERDGKYFRAPGGAKSWTSNAAGTVWTFKLNDNKWSDGKPVTAQDYVYAVKRIVDPKTGAPLSYMLEPLLNFKACNTGEKPLDELGIKALDDKTVEVTLTNPTPYFLDLTHSRVFLPLRQDVVEKYGEKYGSEAETMVCNGPFKIDSWTHNNMIVLKKNNEYWDKDSVKLQTINYAIMADESTYLNAFDGGEIDIISAVSKKEWIDRFKQKKDVDYNIRPTATLVYTFFNTHDKIFTNANIRKAFMLGIDREELNEMCFSGLRIPTYGWVAPSIYVGSQNYRAAAGDVVKKIAEASPSPKELLIKGMEELGLGNDPSTLKLKFSLAGTNDWYRTLGEYLQQAYKQSLGVNLEISFAEWGIFSDNISKGNFQMGFMAWGAFYNEPFDVLGLFISSSNAIKTGWANKKYDALMAQASKEMDENKRIQLYIEAEKILLQDDAVVSPLATSTFHEVKRSYLRNTQELTFSSVGFKYAYTVGRPK